MADNHEVLQDNNARFLFKTRKNCYVNSEVVQSE